MVRCAPAVPSSREISDSAILASMRILGDRSSRATLRETIDFLVAENQSDGSATSHCRLAFS